MDAQTLGLVGFALYMGSYFALQIGRIDGNGLTYAIANLAAASCVLVSLGEHFNLPSMLIQISWIGISLVGIARQLFATRNETIASA